VTRFKAPSAEALVEIRQEFAAMGTYHDFVNADSDEEFVKEITMSDLYAYATGGVSYPNSAIEAALERAAGLRSAFRRMVLALPGYRFERAAAASAGGTLPRQTQGAEIKFSPSRAHDDRTYIIIELKSSVEPIPNSLAVFDSEDRAVRVSLPPPQDSIIQLLVRKDSDILRVLRDPDTDVVLM